MKASKALSKIENGDRRVDVDDLTVFTLISARPRPRSSPRLATPRRRRACPKASTTARSSGPGPAGKRSSPRRDLARYWKDEYFSAVSSIRYYENLMMQYADGREGNTMHGATYEQRLAAAGARRDEARLRLLVLDPDALPAPRDDGWT